MCQKEGFATLSTDLKTRERFTNTLNKLLKKNLLKLSDEARIPQSRLLDEAVEDLLLKYQKQGFKITDTLSDEEEEKIYG
jgi:TRAP-type C4-dicarboxylate transport system substrate-binding protein